MRILIIGLVVLALSVAGISTYLIQNYTTPEAIGELEKKANLVTYQTLVSNIKLQPGDVLTVENIIWREWPDESLSEHYITVSDENEKAERMAEVLGSTVRRMVEPGEPVLKSKIFKTGTAGFMSGVLDRGMRAVSIDVTPDTGVGGFILPGDRVDVLIIHNKGKEAIQKSKSKIEIQAELQADKAQPLTVLKTTTETVMHNILVLAIDQILGEVEGLAVPARSLTLQMTPKQVEIFMTARSLGQIAFSLRDLSASGEAADALAAANGDMLAVPELPGSYTNDVEVSPFMRAVATGLFDEQKEQERLIREQAANAVAMAEAALSDAEKKTADLARQLEEQSVSSAAEIEAAEIAKSESEKLAQQLSEQSKQTTQQVQPAQPEVQQAQHVHTPKKKKKEPGTVEIYRAGTSETEVIEFK